MSCSCWECRKAGGLAVLAPRLRRAHALQRERDRLRRQAQDEELQLERLVAHRELQLVRAASTGRRRYIDKRQAKLQSAQAALRATRNRVKDLAA